MNKCIRPQAVVQSDDGKRATVGSIWIYRNGEFYAITQEGYFSVGMVDMRDNIWRAVAPLPETVVQEP